MNIQYLKQNIIDKMPAKLRQLAKLFQKKGAELYIVGGFIRDCALGDKAEAHDFDLSSKLTVEEVEKMLAGTQYKTILVNKKIGTIHIFYKDKLFFEYTPFRKENYQRGFHTPVDVQFIDNIELDAKRRDFTMNSVYYNILKDEIIDFYDGLNDIENKVIKCIESPEFVFKSDGLRLLRMVRFCCQLDGFEIEQKTYEVAKEKANLLNDISQERIAKEILYSLQCLNSRKRLEEVYDFIYKLVDLGLLNIILRKCDFDTSKFTINRLEEVKKAINFDYDMTDAISCFAIIITLLLDVKFEEIDKVCSKILAIKGLQIEKKKASQIADNIAGYFEFIGHDYLNMDANIDFVQRHYANLDEIFKFLGMIESKYDIETQKQAKYELEGAILFMRLNDIPFSMKDLPINGWDIKRIFPNIDKSRIKEMLDWVFNYATKHYTQDKTQIIFALERKEDDNADIKSLFNIE